uniref:Uncharacterized protein n=1 Tax=Romanomermis culicivorax TaxID=13658 RepID=A0A915HX81_ROMCU
MRMVAENLGGDQANPDEVTGTVARKPRVRRVKTTPVKRAARRASVSKVEVGTEMHFLPSKISIPIPISDLDLEIFTRAQSFQLLSEIFAREARRETKRVNRHGKKMAVLPLGKDDGDLVRDGTPAENGDCPGKMILNENPELNSMSREEGTAV